jgi:hypothetical protein
MTGNYRTAVDESLMWRAAAIARFISPLLTAP